MSENYQVSTLAENGNRLNDLKLEPKNEANEYDERERGGQRNSCGWLVWRPACLRCFTNPRWLLVTMCCFVFVQSMAVNGLTDGSLASLQRRFELSSFQTGLLPAVYDMVAAFFGVFVAYVGNKGNKPRLLTVGILFVGAGSFVFALPHFTTGPYVIAAGNTSDVCSAYPQERPSDNGATIASLSGYLFIFILASALFAIGGGIAYSVGYAFVDESITTINAGVYLGILSVCATLGPAFGLMFAGILLSVYTDFHVIEGSLPLDSSSEQWVGAWWLGFIICAIASLIIAIPMSCFPKELPDTRIIREQRESQAHAHSDKAGEATRAEFSRKWRDFPSAARIMLRNPTLLASGGALAADNILLAGVGAFLPIYPENQYGLSSGIANVIVGAMVCVPGAASLFVGGWLIKRFDLKVRGMLKFVMANMIANCLTFPALFLLCPEIPLAGVYQHYSNNSDLEVVHLDDPCNAGCHCSTSPYEPVCGSNDVMYFSPCFAGCQGLTDGEPPYRNCTCTTFYNTSTTINPTAVPGRCSGYCSLMYVFLCCLVFVFITSFLDRVASTNVVLRCVPDGQQSFALGIYGFIARVFGSLPGPVIVGSIIDSTCTLWHKEGDQRGQCWFHDRTQLALYIIIFAVCIKTLAFCFIVLAYKLYKSPTYVSDDKRGSVKDIADV